MLVEDDPSTQKLEQLVLEREGYAVDIAGSGEKGLTAMMATNPNLVVVDSGLLGNDGYTTCLKIREVSSVPIIIVTGRYPSEERGRGLESGTDIYITKLFSPKELSQMNH